MSGKSSEGWQVCWRDLFLEQLHKVKKVDRRGKMDDWEEATSSSRDFPEEPHHWEEEGSSSCHTILQARLVFFDNVLFDSKCKRMWIYGLLWFEWCPSYVLFFIFLFFLIYMSKWMEWDHGRLWWELCYRLWRNWSEHDMLWAFARG